MSKVETTAYLLYYFLDGIAVPFYVGESVDCQARLQRHRRAAANPRDPKPAYEHLRQMNVKEFFIETHPDRTESELIEELTLLGVTLFNAKGGNVRRVKKKRNDEFARMNKEARDMLAAVKAQLKDDVDQCTMSRQLLAENASARRLYVEECRRSIIDPATKGLHGLKQALSKSEIVQQRITDRRPLLSELLEATWFPVDSALLGERVSKTAESAETVKFGDYSIYLAYRNKGREVAALVRHPRRESFYPAGGAGFVKTAKVEILKQLLRFWDGMLPCHHGYVKPTDF